MRGCSPSCLATKQAWRQSLYHTSASDAAAFVLRVLRTLIVPALREVLQVGRGCVDAAGVLLCCLVGKLCTAFGRLQGADAGNQKWRHTRWGWVAECVCVGMRRTLGQVGRPPQTLS